MISIIYIRVVWLLILLLCTRPAGTQAQGYASLVQLIDHKDLFRLRSALPSLKDSITPAEFLFFRAFTEAAGNQNKEAILTIDSCLWQSKDLRQPKEMPDSLMVMLLRQKEICYFRLYRYAAAAAIDSLIIQNYASSLSEKQHEAVSNRLAMRNALRDIPAQQTIIRDNTIIQGRRNKNGLIEVPVGVHNMQSDAVFDTGANISCITASGAQKAGLRVLPGEVEVHNGLTGLRFPARMAVADSLYLGDVLIRHTVFQVIPDEYMRTTFAGFTWNMLIGFPVIASLGELRIEKSGAIRVNKDHTDHEISNLCLDGMEPLIRTAAGTDTLIFHFDLGSASSTLSGKYFTKYRDEIEKKAAKRTIQLGGPGGVIRRDIYSYTNFHMTCGGRSLSLPRINILSPQTGDNEMTYGFLGQDIWRQFEALTINLQQMYVVESGRH